MTINKNPDAYPWARWLKDRLPPTIFGLLMGLLICSPMFILMFVFHLYPKGAC